MNRRRTLLLLSLFPASLVPATSDLRAQDAAPRTCIAGARSLSHSTTHIDDDVHTMVWRASNCEVRVRVEGDVKFTDDWRTVAALGRDGRFSIEESGRIDRDLRIRPGADGALSVTYEVDGARRELDPQGRAWLESVVAQLFARTTYRVKDRVQWMLQRGGPDAVMATIDSMDGDYARHAYSQALLGLPGADAALQARVLRGAAQWDSDHYKSELLGALAARAPVDQRVWVAAWDVVRTLDSDHYAVKGIQRLLKSGTPGPEQAEVALAAVEQLDSDHYRHELLKSVATRVPLEGRVVTAYLKAAGRTDSDHYRNEMLGTLIDRAELSTDQLVQVIQATAGLDSDHYRAQALVRIARKHVLKDRALDAYMAATDRIKSTHYYSEAVRAVRGERVQKI